ncbi:hypothetical protein [Nonomuraea sp. NPDC005650]|uniref:Rv1733c family protein n=1 Tax=Nonomuraea sp. NPDC005650 TaxID=3157045 RepID=UPI0033A04246
MMKHVTESVMRWVRRHRPDGNPLRRRSDRLESAALLVTVLLVLLSGWPAAVAGRQAYEHALRAADDGRREVVATLLAGAPVTSLSFGEVPRTEPAPARWTTPSGLEISGSVMAPPLAKAGTPIRIWIDPGGRRVAAPPSPVDLRVTAVATALLLVLATAVVAAAGFAGVRRLLDRGRYREWEAAWSLADARRRRQS